jgi:rubrerythrin
MVGVITTWDILAHPIVTIRSFGWNVFFRAVFSSRDKPFLSLLQEVVAPSTGLPPLLKRCIELELRAKRIYAALAKAFADQRGASHFFLALVQQEQDHADLLELCRTAAIRGDWKVCLFNPWQDYLPRLEQQMEETEASVYKIDSVDAALQLVFQIESSEINYVFRAAIAATDSAFVKRLKPFQKEMEYHLSYIVDRISQLAPYLTLACRELRAKFPRVVQ